MLIGNVGKDPDVRYYEAVSYTHLKYQVNK